MKRTIMGARWLLGEVEESIKLLARCMFFFFTNPVFFHVQEGHIRMMLREKWLSVEAYDFDRGRVRAEVASDSELVI